MICPSCNEGILEEDQFDEDIGECDICGDRFVSHKSAFGKKNKTQPREEQ